MSLLLTKLHAPSVRANLVARPQLIARLAHGLSRPLTIICAPAGFGKTTLATHFPQAAWLSLDQDDNDPTRFFKYLIAALQTLAPTIGDVATALLQSPQPAPLQDVIITLINDLVELHSPCLLVLDDYHLINTKSIHEAVTYLLDHCPPTFHLVITTRTEPPLPLARLRARDQVSEIRADDLRFTSDEAEDFLNRIMGLSLSSQDVARIEERAEGWAAGLQFAALSLRQRSAPLHFIESFSGSQAHLVEYFGDEVLQRQPDELKIFLLQTSILNRLTAGLCNAVTLRSDSRHLLNMAHRHHLFISPLDETQEWYRYHSLFSDFLRQHLQQHHASEIVELHRRASLWHEQQGFTIEAIDHAISAGDLERATRLIDAAAVEWLRRGEIATLLTQLSALPDANIRASANLCLWKAWAFSLSDRLNEIEPWLHIAEEKFLRYKRRAEDGGENDAALLWGYRAGYGQATAIRSTMAIQQGDYKAAINLAQQALDLLPRNDLVLPSVMELNLGLAHLALGDGVAATPSLQQAIEDSRSAGHSYIHISALIAQGRAYLVQGDTPRAKLFFLQATQFANENHLSHLAQPAVQELAKLDLDNVSSLNNGLLDPLNKREIEILRLLSVGRSNQAIADQLVIAVSTVRWHIKHLYSKLDVHNRTQAVYRARELNLL